MCDSIAGGVSFSRQSKLIRAFGRESAESSKMSEIFVTHVETDHGGNFLRLFGQTDKKEPMKIEAYIRDIIAHERQLVRPEEIQLKMRCLTQYEDGMYYRAQITKLLDRNFVSVFFIDYGNSATVNISKLLSLHSQSQQALYLMGTSPQASEYILARITGPWSQEQLKRIQEEICNESHPYHIEDKVDRIPIIGVLYRNYDYSQYLIDKRQTGTFISVKSQKDSIQAGTGKLITSPMPKPIPDKIDNITGMKYLQSSGHLKKIFDSKPKPSTSTNPFLDGSVELPKPSPSLRLKMPDNHSPTSPQSAGAVEKMFKQMTLVVHSMYEVMCSHIEDGYRMFYVQLKQKEAELRKLQADLAHTPLHPLLNQPKLGMACIARHDKNGRLYRGIITTIKPNSCVVSFVDYGVSQPIPCGSLFEIPNHFMRLKMFAVQCTLYKNEELSDKKRDLKDYFHQLIINKELLLKVMPCHGATFVQTCELYLNNSNIMDELKHILVFGLQYQPIPRLSPDFQGPVIVRYVDTPKKFYVQLVMNIPEHDSLMDKLSISCQKKPKPLMDLKVGSPCAVSWDNDVDWYRGKVVEVKNAEKICRVRLVDYGKIVDVSASRLQEIEYQFTQMPPQVYECCIKGFENIYDVTESSANAFDMLVEKADGERKSLKMHILDFISDDILLVNLFDESQVPPVNISRSLCKSQMPYKDYVNMFEKKQPGTSQKKESFGRNEIVFDNVFNFSTSSDVNTYAKDGEDRIIHWNNGNNTPDRGLESAPEKSHHNDRQQNFKIAAGDDKWNANDKKNLNNNLGDKTQKRPYVENAKGFERRDTQVGKPNCDRGSERGTDRNNDRGGDRSPRKNIRGPAKETRPNQAQNNHVDANNKDWNVSSAQELKTVDSISLSSTDFKAIDINFDFDYDVFFTYWLDPDEFYVQMKIYCKDYDAMLKEIQNFYPGKKPIGAMHYENGWCVIARNSRDELLHRAKVCDYNKKLNKYKVLFVDRGYRGVVTPDLMWPITEDFMKLPAMALRCSLANNNSTLDFDQQNIFNQISNYINDSMNISCKFNGVKDKIYGVTIVVEKGDLLQALINDGLVKVPSNESTTMSNDSVASMDVDVQLLVGQTIYAKLINIENLEKFQIMLQNTKVILSAMYYNVDFAKAIDVNIVDHLKSLEGKLCPVKVTRVGPNDSLRLNILTNNFLEEPPILCHQIIFQTKSTVLVAHVESLNVIYIHKTENFGALSQQLDEMFEFYDATSAGVCNPDEVTLNKIMAVKSADENWYRGMVVNINGEDVTVKYIDYGNNETVKMNNLRLLNEKFSNGSRYATRIFLPLECLGGTEAESAVEEMRNMITSSNPVLTILKRYHGEWIGELSVNDCSIAGELEKKGLAKVVETDKIYQMIEKADGLMKDDPIESEAITAFVTHIVNPTKFYLQEASIQDELYKLQEDIQIVGESLPPLSGGKFGDLCLGKYSIDGLWYRARILDSTVDMTTLQYIDYGNSDVITDASFLREISEAFADIKPYARLCSLPLIPKGHEDDWSQTAVDIMQKLYQDQSVRYTVISEKNNECYVHLYTEDGTNAEKLLLMKSLADPLTIIEPHSIGFVSHINTLEDFYMQMEKDTEDLEKIFNTLKEIATTGEDVAKMEEGKMYAALFPEDNSWYRAKLIHSTAEGLEVFFVDYGNTGITSRIKNIPKKFAELPIMSKKCCLEPPKNDTKWSEEAQIKFRELAKDGETCFEIVQMAAGETTTVRLFLDGINVLNLLETKTNQEGLKSELPSYSEDGSQQFELSTQHEESISAVVSHVNSLDDFYLHLSSVQNDLDRVLNHFENPSLNAITKTDKDTLCAAKFSADNYVYRAKIEATEDVNQFRVFFIDYGNTTITSDIWELPTEIENIEPLAIQCRLKKNTPGPWTDQAYKKFMEIVQQGETKFNVVFVDKTTSPALVKLFLDEQEICLEEDSVSRDGTDFCEEASEQDISNESRRIAEQIVENSIDRREMQDYTESLIETSMARVDAQKITEEMIDMSISQIAEDSNQLVELHTTSLSDISSYHENSDEVIQNGHEASDGCGSSKSQKACAIDDLVKTNGIH